MASETSFGECFSVCRLKLRLSACNAHSNPLSPSLSHTAHFLLITQMECRIHIMVADSVVDLVDLAVDLAVDLVVDLVVHPRVSSPAAALVDMGWEECLVTCTMPKTTPATCSLGKFFLLVLMMDLTQPPPFPI